MLGMVLPSPMPDILYDGILSPARPRRRGNRGRPEIGDNGEADFANFNMPDLDPKKIFGGKYQACSTTRRTRGVLPAVARVDLEPLSPPDLDAAAPYADVPTRLSAWPILP